MSIKIDLTSENLSTIRSLVSEEVVKQMKEGHDRRSSQYRAYEKVAPCIYPEISASDLMSWVGKSMSAISHQPKPRAENVHITIPQQNSNGNKIPAIGFVIVEGGAENDEDFAGKQHNKSIASEIKSALSAAHINDLVKFGPFPDYLTAQRYQRSLAHVARELKFPRIEGDKPGYQTVIKETDEGYILKFRRIA